MEKFQKYRFHCSFEKTQNFQKFKNLIFERFGEIEFFSFLFFFKDSFNEFLKRKFWDFKWTETFKNEVLGPPQAEFFLLFWGSSFTKNTFLSAIWCSFDPTCAPLTLSRLRRHVCAPLAAFGGVAPNAPLAPPPAAICSYAPLVFLQPASAAFFKPRISKTQCFSNPPPPAACAPMLLCSFEW